MRPLSRSQFLEYYEKKWIPQYILEWYQEKYHLSVIRMIRRGQRRVGHALAYTCMGFSMLVILPMLKVNILGYLWPLFLFPISIYYLINADKQDRHIRIAIDKGLGILGLGYREASEMTLEAFKKKIDATLISKAERAQDAVLKYYPNNPEKGHGFLELFEQEHNVLYELNWTQKEAKDFLPANSIKKQENSFGVDR